jgi:hypothetical protein
LVAPSSAACRSIVAVSQRSNAYLGLTGFLHAEDGLFIQYLEGAPEQLWAHYEHISLDLRHTDLLLLGQGELKKPRFEGWSMGYSESNVLSFADFHEEVSLDKQADKVLGSEAIIFLLAACARIDLGIMDAPKFSWH